MTKTGGRDQSLLGVARVALAQADNGQQTVVETPDAVNIRHAAPFQMIPQLNIGRDITPTDRTKWRCAGDNRMVTMINALDAHHRFRTLVCVVTRPFAEGTFVRSFFRRRGYHAFDHQLRTG